MIVGGQSSLEFDVMYDKTLFFSNTLRSEFLNRDSRGLSESMRHRIDLLKDEKELTIEESPGNKKTSIKLNPKIVQKQPTIGQGNVAIRDATFSMMNFFSELVDHVYDTYFIVLIALDNVISGNLVIKESNLVENLHFAIIEMYNENLIPSLQSCL